MGREAVLFGGVGMPSVDEWADAAGSINYEIITRISSRVERKYTDSEGAKA
ncbi:alanine racemase C-terminal domain-containing protein [Leifsonia sp. SIMBA_070]|uniref:alanine racemase C-terminal domain-containing protein n=1 Tax=Leifsonia sp. SIMBA_070 TaxID=3085810 RepID=UPI00397D3CC0